MLQQFGTPAEIYNNPANMFVADFMGSPAMNLVPGDDRSGRQCADAVVARARRLGSRSCCRYRAADGARRPCRQGGDLRHPAGGADRPDGADRNARHRHPRELPDRGGRAGRLRHLRRDPARRQGGRGAAARRRRQCSRARHDAASPSTWTRRCSSIRRRSNRIA